ncbi:MAG: hypothetical protein SGILL_003266 [Bacillariaceae sp.]
MKLQFCIAVLVLSPLQTTCFHVDSSQEHTRKTYLKRTEKPNQIRHDNQKPPEALTSEDRSWRFPKTSQVRPSGDTTLSSLTDSERLWRQPEPNMLRHVTSVGHYLDEDRMWRKPNHEFTRHENSVPPDALKNEERFWRRDEHVGNLLLEINTGHPIETGQKSHSFGTQHTFRRPSLRLSRHPHSNGRFDDDPVSTMQEDDRLTWLMESTHKLLQEEGPMDGND